MKTDDVHISCVRCKARLEYVETSQFVERDGVVNLMPAVALPNTEPIELYACSICGHVELFLGSRGGAKRGRPTAMTATRIAGRAVGRFLKKGASKTAKNPDSKSPRQ